MIHVRPMTAADLPLGKRLSKQAGWNQTEADWQRCLRLQDDGCFAAELDGVPVGTATTCIFGRVAWVAMVLVEANVRGRGIGNALMHHALAFLDDQGAATVRLDATPLGQPLYEKLGFFAQFTLSRHAGTLPAAPAVAAVETARTEDLDAILRLDAEVTATDRSRLLHQLAGEQPHALRVVREQGRIAGFAASRPGARALFIGPCAGSAEAGPLLLGDAWHRFAGRQVYLDIPDGNAAAAALARQQGLTVQRTLLRMCRGPQVLERLDALWASFGPEKG